MSSHKVSIVIPAHNEESVIFSCLSSLMVIQDFIQLQVIVVCNGCSDNTANIVRSFDGVDCIEESVASKTRALNLGDGKASYFPRFYLDADVRVTPEGVRDIVDRMNATSSFAASPSVEMDFSECSWLVKSYYKIWCGLPYCRAGMIGAGVYVLSKTGRSFFSCFPEIIADDRYVRALFSDKQRICVDEVKSVVSAPTNIWGLIKIKTRSRLGGYEFEAKYPELIGNEKKDYALAAAELLPKIHLWPKVVVYLAINFVSRIRAKRQLRLHTILLWERDDSSRLKIK